MHNSIYQSCEGVTDSDILTIQENIRSRQETIRKEILIVVEKKRYLNRLLPICRLSGKALSHICSYLTHDRTPPPFLRTRYPCITMSHVCHSWRETVLQIPELWSTFCLGSPHCVALHLERSGDALLQVSTTRPSIIANFDNLYAKPQFSTFATDALKLVLRQSHRVRSLTLDVSKRALEDAFDHFYKDVGAEHKSALQSIILITKGSCELPNILSVPHLSALTCIELRGYQMVWHPSLLQFTTLNRIIIRNSRTHDSCSCGIHGLLHVLRNNPRVRVLEFVDASRDSTCSDSIDTPGEELLLISLRSLETLKIHSDAACINFFLTQCAIPTLTITDLKACDIIRSSPSAADFRKTIHTLRSVMSHIAKKSSLMNGLQLTFHYLLEAENANITIRRPPNGIVFQTYHYNPSCERTPSTTHREQLVERDQFHFHYPSFLTTGFSDTLRDLLLVLPLSGVTYIRIATTTVPPSDNIAKELATIISNLLQSCSPWGVETLDLSQFTIFVLPLILSSMNQTYSLPVADTPTCYSPSLFCALRTLIFSRFRGGGIANYQGPTHNYLGFGRIFDALRSQAALYRGTCGRFSRLIIAHCEMDNDTLYELVDSCADIVCQRGRFTNNPQVYPYHYPFTRFTPPLRPPRLPAQKPLVLLPDADLDGPPPGGHDIVEVQHPFNIGIGRPPEGEEVSWDVFVKYGYVTFDFRGSSGIRIVNGRGMV